MSPTEQSAERRAPRTTSERPSTRSAWATFGVFLAAGLLMSSWVSQIPSVRAAIDVDPAKLGLVLLALSAGAVLGLPAAGAVVGRLGVRRTVVLGCSVSCTGTLVVAFASAGPIPGIAAGLFLLGAGLGAWDVAMNVEGAAVERALGLAIMPRLHAGYSFGTVLGALIGSAVQAAHVSARLHLIGVALVLLVTVPWLTKSFLPVATGAGATGGPDAKRRYVRSPWLERRTLLIGLFVLTVAFAEGSANDWLALATVSGYHRSAAFGSLMYGSFVAAMTMARLTSTRLLDRFGRVPVLRVGCAVAGVGVACVVLGPNVAFLVVGSMLWGLGASTGFPVGMSAAADDPARGHARVGTVSTIAYTAFLAGPPLIGLIGNRVGVRHALGLTGVLVLGGLLLAGNTSPSAPDPRTAPADTRSATTSSGGC